MRINRKDVEGRLEYFNVLAGTNYKTDFASHYGGWNLYIVNKENGGHSRGAYGFDVRKSTAEFMEYLNGMIRVLESQK